MSITDNKRFIRYSLHVLFWAVNIVFFILAIKYVEPQEDYGSKIIRLLEVYAFIALSVYINLYFLIPKLLLRKKYLRFAIGFCANIALFSFLKIFTKISMLKSPIDKNYFEEITTAVAIIVFYLLIVTFIKYLVRFLRDRIVYQEMALKVNQIEKEKLSAELTALQGQLNPHFMFNTLNNVYALSLDKSEKTSELILRFSNLLSYTLYECKDEYVLLSKELEFISNYVELEKIRLDDEISIGLVVNGNLGTRKIAPLIFLPLIENAFKHGVNLRPNKAFVSIQIDISEENLLQFSIENSFSPTEADSNGKNGIGLVNVRKRLDLLYQSQHKLKIDKTEEKYKVELEIYLT